MLEYYRFPDLNLVNERSLILCRDQEMRVIPPTRSNTWRRTSPTKSNSTERPVLLQEPPRAAGAASY